MEDKPCTKGDGHSDFHSFIAGVIVALLLVGAGAAITGAPDYVVDANKERDAAIERLKVLESLIVVTKEED